MLRVKILINLQVGSVRVEELRDTLCVCSKAVSTQDLPGNHRGGRSRFSVRLLIKGSWLWGICSARIDLQLGTNAADTNRLKI